MPSFEWQEPTDESLVPVPDGWQGGGLEGIGGGGAARTWYHKQDDTRVIYEPFDRRVALQAWNGRSWEEKETLEASEASDRALARVARELMERENRRIQEAQGNSGGSNGGFVFGDSFGHGSDLDF